MTATKTLVAGAAAVTALLTLGACSNSNVPQAGSSTAGTSVPAPHEAHNRADAMFAQMMIPHHRQAIEMSDMVLGKQGIDPRVLDLATQIKAAQGPEIEQLQSWLTQWGTPTMPMTPGMNMPSESAMPSAGAAPSGSGAPHGDMPGSTTLPNQSTMPGMTAMPGMGGMNGMMSEQDMAALQNAQGVDASKLFLTQMIAHHQGAIGMAQNESNTGQYPAALAMAKDIETSQQKEIDTMNQLLATL